MIVSTAMIHYTYCARRATVLLLVALSVLSHFRGGKASAAKDPRPTMEDYRVTGLEQVEPAYSTYHGDMYAGLIPSTLWSELEEESKNNATTGQLMFWLFEPDSPTYDDTLTVWMNGGPGCSSLGGCLFEHCPVTIGMYPAGFYGIDSFDALRANPYAWTRATRMLYVEQPHGTGFSTGPFPDNEEQVAAYFYNFMQNFYTIFPHLLPRKLFFMGESYAGMYVPSIAHYIYKANVDIEEKNNRHSDDKHINLAGLALGNGWIDATVQGPAVIDYAWWHGMIDSQTKNALHQEWNNCKDGSSPQPLPFHPFTTPDECGIMGALLQAAGQGAVDWGGPNAYDVTTWDPYTMLDAPDGAMATFYNDPKVQDALNIHPHRFWYECMPGAGRRRHRKLQTEVILPGQILLAHDEPISVVPYIAELLDKTDIQVLIYNGDRDMTTNAMSSEMLLDSMQWSGAAGWADPEQYTRGLWLPTNMTKTLGGYMKVYKNLGFLVVSNSGHLVPFNEPDVALDLVTRFLGNKSFVDKELPYFNITPKNKTKVNSDHNSGANSDTKHHRQSFPSWYMSLFTLLIGFLLGYAYHHRFVLPDNSRRGTYQTI